MHSATKWSTTLPGALWALSVASRMGLYSQVTPGEKCYMLAPAPLHVHAWGFTVPSGNSDNSEHLRSYYYYLLFVRWYLLMGSTARWVLLCYVQIKNHLAVVQVYWRSLAESGFPISTTQSRAHIPRLRQDSHCSISHSFTSVCRRDSAVFLASTQPVVHPLRLGLFPPRNAPSVCFSHVFQGSVLLTQQRVPKPAGGVLKRGATRSVCSLWRLTHALFFLRSCISHFQEDRRSWQRCDLITSWGSELLRLARAGCCLLLCFGWWQNWVEEDQAEYLMIRWFSH